MRDVESVLSDAICLPANDRLHLIEALWDTLPPDSLPPISAEWISVIQRRSAEYDAGEVQTISWEQVRAEAMQRAGLRD